VPRRNDFFVNMRRAVAAATTDRPTLTS